MTRINTNLPSLMGALHLSRNMDALNLALERMASGLRINTAKDDPAGIVVTDVLRAEIGGLNDATRNAERASNLMATAEGSMASVSDLLLAIKQIAHDASSRASLTSAEIDALQLQIDNNVAAINQIVKSATFGGQKLLDGSLGYKASNVDPAAVNGLTVYAAPLGAASGELSVRLSLLVPAERAALIFPNPSIPSAVSVTFTGPRGTEHLQFNAGTSSTELVAAVNTLTDSTGLAAAYLNGDPAQGVVISTVDYGSRAAVTVSVTQGNPADFALRNAGGSPASTDTGADLVASINGNQVVGDGLRLHYAAPSTDFDLDIQEAWNNAGPPAATVFQITSGGALFQIGPRIGAEQQVSIGIPAFDSTNLGRAAIGFLNQITSGGAYSLKSGNTQRLAAIVDEAVAQATSIRARIGSFQNNTLTMIINSLKQSLESVSAARSEILDTDYAVETAAMTRQQILIEATRSVMALAQQVPQHVLDLLTA